MTDDEWLDDIYNVFNNLLCEGDFTGANAIIRACDPYKVPLVIAIGVLTITAAAKTKLPARADYFECAKQRAESEGKDANRLLDGLE